VRAVIQHASRQRGLRNIHATSREILAKFIQRPFNPLSRGVVGDSLRLAHLDKTALPVKPQQHRFTIALTKPGHGLFQMRSQIIPPCLRIGTDHKWMQLRRDRFTPLTPRLFSNGLS
jgi:hypothetical protein